MIQRIRNALLGLLVLSCAASAVAQTQRVIVINTKGPILCTFTSYVDCPDDKTLGELHNDLLGSTFGPAPDASRHSTARASSVTDLMSRFSEPQSSNLRRAMPFDVLSVTERRRLTRVITERFSAAGLSDQSGRFRRESFEDPTTAIRQLERRRTISAEFAAVLRQLHARRAPLSDFQSAFRDARWRGGDRLAGAVLVDVMTASASYWGETSTARHTALWDALGSLLLIETGPGSIIGGVVMSAASCWCFDF